MVLGELKICTLPRPWETVDASTFLGDVQSGLGYDGRWPTLGHNPKWQDFGYSPRWDGFQTELLPDPGIR